MESRLAKVYLTQVGVLAPLGDNIKDVHCAWQAGINTYIESPVHGHGLQPLSLSLVPESAIPVFDVDSFRKISYRENRVTQLSCAALQQLDTNFISQQKMPLFLAAFESLAGYSDGPSHDMLKRIWHHSGIHFDLEQSKVYPQGRAAGAYVLEQAFQFLETSDNQYCLVGGVDSYLDLMLLKQLDREGRIKKPGAMDAFTPAEGAVFLVLSKLPVNYGRGQAAICRPGLTTEDGHRYSDAPYTAEALANAVKLSLQFANGEKISSVYSSVNGESFGNKEYGVAMIRQRKFFTEDYRYEHPADCYGDLGAATVPMLIALASENKEKNAIIVAASDASSRGVVKLEYK